MPTYTHHHLTAEHINDEHGPGVMLTQQDSIDDPCSIVMHPWQLVAACQHLGLSVADPNAEKSIAKLQERLLLLKSRIDHLGEYLALHSDHRHADLSYETNYATATADICDAYCKDFLEISVFVPDKRTKEPDTTHQTRIGTTVEKKGVLTAGLFDLEAAAE